MTSIVPRSPIGAAFARPFMFAVLTGAVLMAGSPAATAADVGAASHKTQHQMKSETIDERIAALHASLKITGDEEANWASVAQVMRDNDAALKVLVAARAAETREKVSAVEDLRMYEKFAQAHVDGLKNLISSFETLYGVMPDPQKAIADGVFQSVGRDAKRSAH
jgi:hypothetical protein